MKAARYSAFVALKALKTARNAAESEKEAREKSDKDVVSALETAERTAKALEATSRSYAEFAESARQSAKDTARIVEQMEKSRVASLTPFLVLTGTSMEQHGQWGNHRLTIVNASSVPARGVKISLTNDEIADWELTSYNDPQTIGPHQILVLNPQWKLKSPQIDAAYAKGKDQQVRIDFTDQEGRPQESVTYRVRPWEPDNAESKILLVPTKDAQAK